MMRKTILAVLVGLLLASVATAQPSAWRFRWQKGQSLTYRVEQTTSVAEEVGETNTTTRSKLNLTKRWLVADVDAGGVATLQLSLDALRLENTLTSGESLLFDSADLAKSTPQLREQMQRYVGATLAVLRIDSHGRVVEVKESKFGPASRYQSELPFALALPDRAPEPGQTWERAYQIVLDPPNGAGEKYDAVQKYTCMKNATGAATITVLTTLKSKPESKLDEVPLLQFQPRGEIVFDTQTGMLRSAKLAVDREVVGHQGKGSRYRFQSSYAEELVPAR